MQDCNAYLLASFPFAESGINCRVVDIDCSRKTGGTRNPHKNILRTSAVSFLVLLLVYFSSLPAQAHESIGSVSNAIITVEGKTVNYYQSVPPTIYRLLSGAWGEDERYISEYFTESLKLTSWDEECVPEEFYPPALQPSGNRIAHIVFKCPKDVKDLTVRSSLFFDLDEKHLQFIKLADAKNPRKFLQEAILTASKPVFHIADVKSGESVLLHRAYRFFVLGVKHILTGYDHILFLFSVIITAATFMDSIKIVSSFTVAHSLTLILAFLGVVSLGSNIVEPLIALTIVYVAFENLFVKNHSRRWMLTFVFGLVHGLGFVGVLKEITISRQELITSLLSFNAGIEAGQVLIVGFLIPVLLLIRKKKWSPLFIRVASLCMVAAGLAWFYSRVF